MLYFQKYSDWEKEILFHGNYILGSEHELFRFSCLVNLNYQGLDRDWYRVIYALEGVPSEW